MTEAEWLLEAPGKRKEVWLMNASHALNRDPKSTSYPRALLLPLALDSFHFENRDNALFISDFPTFNSSWHVLGAR